MVSGYEVHEAIEGILNWSREEENEYFDSSFVEDLQCKLEEFGELTPKQEKALENIIVKFDIDISEFC